MLPRFFSTQWKPHISITTCAWDKMAEIASHFEERTSLAEVASNSNTQPIPNSTVSNTIPSSTVSNTIPNSTVSNTQPIPNSGVGGRTPLFIFSATSGGCNGFNYNLKLLDEPTYQNLALAQGVIPLTILKNNTTRVVIDPVSEMVLLGTTIDYVREDYAEGRFENKFVFIPDRDLATSCGCGVSFTPRD